MSNILRRIVCGALAALVLAASAVPLLAAETTIAGVGPVGEVQLVHDGFKFTEGPAADAQGNLYFTDVPASRVLKAHPGGQVEVFLEGADFANGMCFDARGRLLACQGGSGQIIAIDTATKAISVVCAGHQGQRFVRPNDIAVDRAGGVYFTDPKLGKGPGPQDASGVYYASPEGEATRLIDSLTFPNGICLAPDEKTLYVMPFSTADLWAYPLVSPGQLGEGKVLCRLEQPAPGQNRGGDGMTVDTQGRLYVAAPAVGAIAVFTPAGESLGLIRIPKAPSNCEFGGPKRQTLFVTAGPALYAVPLEATGAAP